MPTLRSYSKELRKRRQLNKLHRYSSDHKRSNGCKRFTRFLKLARQLKNIGRRVAPRKGVYSEEQPWQLY